MTVTGIVLNPVGGDAPLLVEAARQAEQAGFESVWCYDHMSASVLRGNRSLDVWSVLGAVAATTTRVRLGPLVANVTTRHAVHIATAAATIQSLSAGRLQLGLGAGASGASPFAAEMSMFQLPQDPADLRRARVAETIAFLRALWAGDDRFDGRWAAFVDVEGVAIPEPLPPIIVGANGPRMAELAGHHADVLNVHAWDRDPAALIRIAQRAAAAKGRAVPSVSVEARFEPEWLDPDSPSRRQAADAGASEVIVGWRAELGLDAIRHARRWLA